MKTCTMLRKYCCPAKSQGEVSNLEVLCVKYEPEQSITFTASGEASCHTLLLFSECTSQTSKSKRLIPPAVVDYGKKWCRKPLHITKNQKQHGCSIGVDVVQILAQ